MSLSHYIIRDKTTFNISKIFLGKLCASMAVFASFYYPISAFIILQLGLPSTPINIFFRSLVSITSVFLILIYILHNFIRVKLSPIFWLLLFWWFFYAIRIVYDLSRGVTFASYGNEFVYGITFGNILFPLIAIVLWNKYFDLSYFVKLSYLFITIGAILILFNLLKQSDGNLLNLFNTRLELSNDKSDSGEGTVLNAIVISFYGELLILLNLNKLFQKSTFVRRFTLTTQIIIGVVLLFLGASRGPFLVCLLLALILLASKFFIAKKKITFLFKIFSITSILFTILKLTVFNSISSEDFVMFRRMTQFVEDIRANESDDRSIIISSAWNDFLDSPIIGKQFVGTLDGYYPHNIIVEVFMSTGILGAILFFPLVIYTLLISLKYVFDIDSNKIYLGILFLACFSFLMTSGSLFQGVEFWIILTIILVSNYVKWQTK